MPASAILLRELVQLVRRVVDLAELLLDRLHLLVEVVLALALLHLRLHAAADALLDLLHVDLAVDEADQQSPAAAPTSSDLEHALLVGRAQRQVRGDGVGEAARLVDARQRLQQFRRKLAIGLDVLLEQRHQRARQRLDLARVSLPSSVDRRPRRVSSVPSRSAIAVDAHALDALDQHLDRAVRQLQQLQHLRQRADLVQVVAPRDRRSRRTSAPPAGCACPLPSPCSSARIDFSRPTNSGITMCGNTTTSRSGSTGRVRVRMVGHGISGRRCSGDMRGDARTIASCRSRRMHARSQLAPVQELGLREEHASGRRPQRGAAALARRCDASPGQVGARRAGLDSPLAAGHAGVW